MRDEQNAKQHTRIRIPEDCHDLDEIRKRGAKPEGVPIELADLIIRVLHYCAYNEIDIEQAIEMKMKYNDTRPYRHGGLKC